MSDPKIQKQRQKRELSPEEQKLVDVVNAAKAQLKEIKKKKADEAAAIRQTQVRISFVVSKHVQKMIAAGNEAAKKLVQDAAAALQASEGYPQERVDADRAIIKAWLEKR